MINKMFLMLLFIIGCSCNSAGNKQEPNKEEPIETVQGFDSCMLVPPEIDSLGYREFHDSVKWIVYIRNCVDTPKDKFGNYLFNEPKSFASYCLKLKYLSTPENSPTTPENRLYFEFAYYINDKEFIPTVFTNYVEWLPVGLILDLDDTAYHIANYFWLFDNTRVTQKGFGMAYLDLPPEVFDTLTDRDLKPLQPDVIEYMNKHKKEIHPWLYSEGLKRGVIKEE